MLILCLRNSVPAYDYPVPGRHDVNTVMRNAGIVMDTGKVIAFATTCFYFDTDAPGRENNNFVSNARGFGITFRDGSGASQFRGLSEEKAKSKYITTKCFGY